MSDVFELTCDLIARPSVTPDDAGCQQLIAQRLQRAGMRFVTDPQIAAQIKTAREPEQEKNRRN